MLQLHEIAKLYASDIYNQADISYFNALEIILKPIQNTAEIFFEIHSDINTQRMWRGFFNTDIIKVVGMNNTREYIRINEDSVKMIDNNIITFTGNRFSEEGLIDIVRVLCNNVNCICDNGEINDNIKSVVITFTALNYCLKPGGIYIFRNISSEFFDAFCNASIFGDEYSKYILNTYDICNHNKSIVCYIKKPEVHIPIVVIAWNNLFFMRNFINQIKRFPNPIIILDNNSSYKPLLEFYIYLKEELKDRISIHLLDKNYGHMVYHEKKNLLPTIFVLSDPDLELHPDMPMNFAEQLLKLSNKYKMRKVGAALEIPKYEECENDHLYKEQIIRLEKLYYKSPIEDPDYELYNAEIDTTFSIINNTFKQVGMLDGIRVGGVFTAKHLPWYKNYLRDNIPKDEMKLWLDNNKSSSILRYVKPKT